VLDFAAGGGRLDAVLPVAILVALALLVLSVSWGGATEAPETSHADPTDRPAGDPAGRTGRAA